MEGGIDDVIDGFGRGGKSTDGTVDVGVGGASSSLRSVW